MRINGTFGYDPRGFIDGSTASGKSAKPADTTAAAELGDDPQLTISDDKYVQAAKAGEEVNSQAVEEAKKLLAAGQLDTPDAIRRAAANMISGGL